MIGVLEAANIRAYRGPRDNDPANGLLLRSDLHTLFDLNRIGINPDNLSLVLHPELIDSEYGPMNKMSLLVTKATSPNGRALRLRWEDFRATTEPTVGF